MKMKRWFCCGLLLLLVVGCSSGSFQIPKQEYQSKVQVLGVLPILLDRAGPFEYPQKEALLDLLLRSANGKYEELVMRLKDKKGYFDVRMLSGNAELIGMSLLAGENPRNAKGQPEGYRYDPQAVAELARQNVVDALLVVVISGAQVKETRRSRTMLETLETSYNDILATAEVVARDGQVLWQLNGDDSYQLLMLQYADFDEAYYNHTDLVRLKNIQLSGIEKVLDETPGKAEQPRLPEKYDKLFDRIVSGISPGLFDSLR